MKTVTSDVHVEGLTLAEANVVSGIGRTKLYEAISNGQLTARKFGSRTIVLRDDLLRFLASLPRVQ
jgi:excisionase family DNA binding protein